MMKLVVLFYTFLRLSWGLEGGRQDKAMEVKGDILKAEEEGGGTVEHFYHYYYYEDLDQPEIPEYDADEFAEVLQLAQALSTKKKLLPNLTLRQLRQLSDEQLFRYASDHEVLEGLPDTDPNVLDALLERLPEQMLADIANREGSLDMLTDNQILQFSRHTLALRLINTTLILDLTRTRRSVIPRLPWQALDSFIRTKGIVEQIDDDTAEYLIQSEEFAEKLRQIPTSTLAILVSANPRLLTKLPFEYPAKDLVNQLIDDKSFLRMVPIQVHSYLAETNFRHHLGSRNVKKILDVYPHLPSMLSHRALASNSKYTRSSRFLASLSCPVFHTLATRSSFIDRLRSKDLQVLARSRHLWSCLPLSVIRKMMTEARLGKKIDIWDIIGAAKAMSAGKSLDLHLALSVLQHQIPDVTRKAVIQFFNLPNHWL